MNKQQSTNTKKEKNFLSKSKSFAVHIPQRDKTSLPSIQQQFGTTVAQEAVEKYGQTLQWLGGKDRV